MPIHEFKECFMFGDPYGNDHYSLCVDCVSSSLAQRLRQGADGNGCIPHHHLMVPLEEMVQDDSRTSYHRLGLVYCRAMQDHVIHPDCVIECPSYHREP